MKHLNAARGEALPQSKLTADKVREIRRRYARGERGDVLALEYGCTRENIWRVASYDTWRHIA